LKTRFFVQATEEEPVTTFESTSRYADVAGARLHYNEAGSGPALLTFHGGGPGANGWDNCKWNLDFLAKNFRTVLVDLPGYGFSENTEAMEGESQDQMYSRVIGALMDHLGVNVAHLYGTSMSGAPVLRFAIDHPERVGRVIVKSPSGLGPSILSASPPDGIVALNVFRQEPTRENMVKMMKLFVPGPGLLTDDMVEARFQSALHAAAMTPPAKRGGPSADLRLMLPTLHMPLLAIYASQDRMVPIDGSLTALSHIPNVRLHMWGGGSGHFIEYEHPEEFNRLVTDFLTAGWDGRNLT
jgi:4,5:9,10-diseco-3-hydroxy-5,9,17-trioxoandrosta-1(10),2-diene-4-oate hydrolase